MHARKRYTVVSVAEESQAGHKLRIVVTTEPFVSNSFRQLRRNLVLFDAIG